MVKKESADQHLSAHPLLSQLLEVGTNVRALRGYIGPIKDNGLIRLYPSLGDLCFCLEIQKDDIVASASAPESLLPHGGTILWVKPDAEVVCHGDRINVVAARRSRHATVRDLVEATPSTSSRLVEVQKGRLNITIRPRVMSTCASCSCSSCEVNPSCTSTCNQISSVSTPGFGRG